MIGLSKRKEPCASLLALAFKASMPRIQLLLIAAFVIPSRSQGQPTENLSDKSSIAGLQLNAVYSSGIEKLSQPNQEIFLRAQMAWTVFSDKEKALVDSLECENLIPEEFAHFHSIAITDARVEHLKAFFVNYNVNYPPQDTPQNQDFELNKAYVSCLRLIDRDNQRLLIPAEEAWTAYRDADLTAVAATDDNPKWTNAAIVQVTMMRIEQLNSIIQALRQLPITTTPVQQAPPPASPISSPNSSDVMATIEFQNDAKAVLNALLAKKDDPFFKNAEALKTAPGLSAETYKQISDLDERYSVLLNEHYAEKLLGAALNESAAVEMLASWSKFTQKLKEGDVVDAELAIQRTVSQRPKEIATDYVPLWQVVGKWHDLFVREEAKYYDHIDKGDSCAGLGKTSAAIKEYQAACDIIANPAVLEKIKKLHEQSLGL